MANVTRRVNPDALDNHKVWRKMSEDAIGGWQFFCFVTTAAGLAIGIFLSIWFLAMLVVPASLMISYNSYLRNSTEFPEDSDGYYGKKSLYVNGLGAYRGIYEKDTSEAARELLQNIWAHETALIKIKKSHGISERKYSDCDVCKDRVQLIEELAEAQHIPGTEDSDVERARNLLDAKKDVKELM